MIKKIIILLLGLTSFMLISCTSNDKDIVNQQLPKKLIKLIYNNGSFTSETSFIYDSNDNIIELKTISTDNGEFLSEEMCILTYENNIIISSSCNKNGNESSSSNYDYINYQLIETATIYPLSPPDEYGNPRFYGTKYNYIENEVLSTRSVQTDVRIAPILVDITYDDNRNVINSFVNLFDGGVNSYTYDQSPTPFDYFSYNNRIIINQFIGQFENYDERFSKNNVTESLISSAESNFTIFSTISIEYDSENHPIQKRIVKLKDDQEIDRYSITYKYEESKSL
ncbi:hypothetical protein [uncultured Algibacter sp.]|uniref:hypothetical protein n=1 Tax=uncultured Algibacter sp. TaxID=298659 RepID=UPI00261A7ADC|nr:hypothetical protein [uncultured Algibacter sp.]